MRRALEYFADLGYEELRLPQREDRGETSTDRMDPATASTAENRPGMDSGGAAALEAVGKRAASCEACALAAGRQTVVFGSGNGRSGLMFVGEGPGAEEDRKGLPFVGPAGALLTKIIAAIGISREDVYIANVVKCRPPANRDPLPEEVAACRDFLEEQIRLVAPRILVVLGRVAAQTLLGSDQPLGRMRGTWYEVQGVPTRVTYHPAALLRNDNFKRPTWEDMKAVRDRLATQKKAPSPPL